MEVEAQTADDFHLLCIALRRMDALLSVSGRVERDGIITPGTLHITEPSVPAACVFRDAYDELPLHIANELISECIGAIPGRHDGLLDKAPPPRDPA